LLAVSMTAIFGFVALSVDIGMVSVSRAQLQNVVDTAAMTGARTLDGSPSGNVANATTMALTAARANKILNAPTDTAGVTIQHGAWHYDSNNETYSVQIPPGTGENYNLTRATAIQTRNTGFARVFRINSFNVNATATAAHRPRDIAVVLDFSGSMNNESDIWNNEAYLGAVNNSPNNKDPVFPKFGHYSDVANAQMQCTSGDARVGKCNVTQPALGVPALVNDYYQHDRGSAASSAFSAASNSYDTQPGGDNFLGLSGSTATPPSTYAKTVKDVTGSSVTNKSSTDYPLRVYDPNPIGNMTVPETNASYYTNLNSPAPKPRYGVPWDPTTATKWKGYTQGPKYYGKTFWIWPPHPMGADHPNNKAGYALDWRQRFFMKTGGSYPSFGGAQDDNTKLYDNSGTWKVPSGNYVVNYKAILAWLKSDPDPFPPKLRAGRILYYDSIPDDVPAQAYDHTVNNYAISWANQGQRFWKEYIDYVLGIWRDPSGVVNAPGNPACSIGPDWTWGTVQITAPYGPYTSYASPDQGTITDDGTTSAANMARKAKLTTHSATYSSGYRMHPLDNPKRPRHRFWFGPMTMVQFMSDAGLNPGTVHDISLYDAKLGISAALEDIKNNHPNDSVSLILFNRPRFNGEASERGRFSSAQYSLSRDYTGMQNALWFPPNTGSADALPWDSNGLQRPIAGADYQGNTCSNYGFMLAYNQFSENSSLRSNGTGGLGRKSAQRLVIFETDGMANVNAIANFAQNGKQSYYQIGPSDTVTSGGTISTGIYGVVDKIVAQETDNTNGPGFSRPGRPVIIHCIGYGPVLEPTSAGGERDNVIPLLKTISQKGGTYFPDSDTDTSNGDQSYKIVIGDADARKTKLEQAFRKVTVNVTTPALIE